MNKTRIEALSDGVFSIVMTLLIIDIKVPAHMTDGQSSRELASYLWALWPLFKSYYISFAVLGMYWITHHALFHMFVKQPSRPLTYINILFLALVSLVPFSAHLLGVYPFNQLAVIIYGGNIIVIGLVQYIMFRWTVMDHTIRHENLTEKTIQQATIRLLLPPVFAVFGIGISYISLTWCFLLFTFPVVFNIIPGSLTAVENLMARIFPLNQN